MRRPYFILALCTCLLVVFAAGLLLADTEPTSAAPLPPAPKAAASQLKGDVERGEYLVSVGACIDCHGNSDEAKGNDVPLAGGTEFNLGPLGIYYAANLTTLQDWTTDDFLKALHEGVDPKTGRILAPIMPYPAYHGMADEDVASIGAYLRSLKPVKYEVPEAKPGEEAAQVLSALPAVSVPMPKIDNSEEYGAYLTRHINVCGDCHSPRDANGGQMPDYELAGGELNLGTDEQPLFAPPIMGSVLTAMGYTEEHFKIVMRTGLRPWGVPVSPPMPWPSYTNMTDNDLGAIWKFLLTLKLEQPWQAPVAPAPGGTAPTPEIAAPTPEVATPAPDVTTPTSEAHTPTPEATVPTPEATSEGS